MAALPAWADALVAFLLVVGTAFALVGAIGLARLSDFLKRLHGPTKATTLGVGSALLASFVYFLADPASPSGHEILIAVFLFLTAPVASHLMILGAMRVDRSARPPEAPRP
jgi:multicomponent K+:H+ antiporter subunit G